ncbi:MAG: thiamine diphosphokinase [Rhodobacteraceae bacterium]|nr:thiamine diphosphokinase [Paracoccaceae bacterium]
MLANLDSGVTILGAGEAPSTVVGEALTLAPELVCADGGAHAALKHGFTPGWVIGDMDSVGENMEASLPDTVFHQIEEQDSTDFDKCLSSLKAPFFIAVGVTGSRLDHGLAALNVMTRRYRQKIILLSETDICFICPPELRLQLEPGVRISFFPMAEVSGWSEGLKWRIKGIPFRPDGIVGTSNETDSGTIRFGFERPLMAVIMPCGWLRQVLPDFVQAPAWRTTRL